MKNDWFTASSFEQTHEIIVAINTLSIHTKLGMAGIDDPANETEVEKAKTRLLKFLDTFQGLLRNAEENEGGITLGADPRLGELAIQYLSQKQSSPHPSKLYSGSFTELADLIRSPRNEELKGLIAYLHDLRALLEQHSHPDVVNILGEL